MRIEKTSVFRAERKGPVETETWPVYTHRLLRKWRPGCAARAERDSDANTGKGDN